jgi:hypothetical protein
MQKIITEWGTQFVAKFTWALNDLLGVETALSTTYHPQMDGQTERINQELEQYLWLYTNFMLSDWVEWLSSAEFTYNNHPHSATGQSPFFLEYGHHPNLPTTVHVSGVENPTTEEFVESLGQTWDVAGSALLHTTETMKRFMDRKRKEVPRFTPGESVWLDLRNISTGHPSKKLDARHTGPFEVVEGIPRDASTPSYCLRLPLSWKVHPVFHVSLLQPAYERADLHPVDEDLNLRPPPDVIEEVEEYEVERILDHKGGKRRRKYLVKWKGYPMSEVSWETKKNLRHAPDQVLEYEASLQSE